MSDFLICHTLNETIYHDGKVYHGVLEHMITCMCVLRQINVLSIYLVSIYMFCLL